MKTKSKVLTAALVCVALVVAFTACAGCTGTDPIVGTWVHTFSDKSGSIVNEFYANETFQTYAVYSDSCVTKDNLSSWKKTGENRYESGLVIYKLGDDGYTLTETISGNEALEYTKYSNYKIPEVTSKDSTIYKEHQMVGTWAYGVTSDYLKLTLDADKTGTMTIKSSVSGSSNYQITWKYYKTGDSGIDFFLVTNGAVSALLGHNDEDDYCIYSIVSSDATPLTLTRM